MVDEPKEREEDFKPQPSRKVAQYPRGTYFGRGNGRGRGRERGDPHVAKAMSLFGVPDLRDLLNKKHQEEKLANESGVQDVQNGGYNQFRPSHLGGRNFRRYSSRSSERIPSSSKPSFIKNLSNITINLSTSTGERNFTVNEDNKIGDIRHVPDDDFANQRYVRGRGRASRARSRSVENKRIAESKGKGEREPIPAQDELGNWDNDFSVDDSYSGGNYRGRGNEPRGRRGSFRSRGSSFRSQRNYAVNRGEHSSERDYGESRGEHRGGRRPRARRGSRGRGSSKLDLANRGTELGYENVETEQNWDDETTCETVEIKQKKDIPRHNSNRLDGIESSQESHCSEGGDEEQYEDVNEPIDDLQRESGKDENLARTRLNQGETRKRSVRFHLDE